MDRNLLENRLQTHALQLKWHCFIKALTTINHLVFWLTPLHSLRG